MALVSENWTDYEIIDAGGGEKLERWGNVIVARPDPQIIWPRMKPDSVWNRCHMHYRRSKDGGAWEHNRKSGGTGSPGGTGPSGGQWTVAYRNLSFIVRPTDFKHMGLFPEQAANWDWSANLVKKAGRPIRILNLFGYTGAATVCCLHAGADVTHVDAAKGMNAWAKDNIKTADIKERICRVMTDDVYKFVQREQRRGSFYDGIMMDPPSYGRGPSGEVWKLENRLYDLLCQSVALLSDKPLFMLLNTYSAGFTATAAENILKLALKGKGLATYFESGPLGLPISDTGLILPCGNTTRCSFA